MNDFTVQQEHSENTKEQKDSYRIEQANIEESDKNISKERGKHRDETLLKENFHGNRSNEIDHSVVLNKDSDEIKRDDGHGTEQDDNRMVNKDDINVLLQDGNRNMGMNNLSVLDKVSDCYKMIERDIALDKDSSRQIEVDHEIVLEEDSNINMDQDCKTVVVEKKITTDDITILEINGNINEMEHESALELDDNKIMDMDIETVLEHNGNTIMDGGKTALEKNDNRNIDIDNLTVFERDGTITTEIDHEIVLDQDGNKNNNAKDKTVTETDDNRNIEIEVPIFNNGDGFNDEFDAFADESGIVRKYRLRRQKSTAQMKQEKTEKIKQPDRKVFKHRSRYDSDEDVDIQCKKCKVTFQSKTGLLNHMRVHQRMKGFTCALCSEEFESNEELIFHKKRPDHVDHMSLCRQCQLAFSNHFDYLQHMVIHTNGPPYRCKECPKTLNTKEGFKIHIGTHFDRLIKCEKCGNSYKNEDRYHMHLKNHNQEFKCGECGKICNSAEMLRYHMVSHTGVKVIQCIYCGKGFANNTARKVHTRMHTNERPYKCKVCDQRFHQKTDLDRHVITKHSECPTYKCEVCDKKYKQKSSLVFHMRTHTRKNLFPCLECDMEFTIFPNLRSHMLYMHTDVRLHRCHVCKVDFKMLNGLRRHNRSVQHKNNAYGAMLKKQIT